MAISKNSTGETPFARLGAPAQRALKNAGILTTRDLAGYSEREILKLHGMGPGSLPKMREILDANGLSFKK